MTMAKTMETLMKLRKDGVDIFLTDEGWTLLVRITEALENNGVSTDVETDQAV